MLDLTGERVVTATHDQALELRTDGGWLIRVETTFQVLTPAGVGAVPTPVASHEDLAGSQDVTVLVGRRVLSTREEGGRLVVDLDGVLVLVDPDPDYEAWELVGPQRQRVICLPGGELSVYS